MAHYSGINESSLISAINNCKNKISKKNTSDLLADAKSLVWEGTDAKENLVETLRKINSTTTKLENELDKCLNIARKIKKYKELRQTIKNLQSQKASLEWQRNNNGTNPDYYLDYAIAEKRRLINAKKDQLESIKNQLSSAGYPPV